MRALAIPLILLGYVITMSSCESSSASASYTQQRLVPNSLMSAGMPSNGLSDSDSTDNNIMDKRAERYAFGLGRRAYTYTSGGAGVKRLPVYNFGLGKRTRPYAFGLGKRSDDDEYSESDLSYDSWPMVMPMSEKQRDYEASEKRARPYSFGLGKRLAMLDDASSVERRSQQRYNFGLGKR